MSVKLLQLGLCIVAVIQMTSSQPTYDKFDFEEQDDSGSCQDTQQALSQLLSQVITSGVALETSMRNARLNIITTISILTDNGTILKLDFSCQWYKAVTRYPSII